VTGCESKRVRVCGKMWAFVYTSMNVRVT